MAHHASAIKRIRQNAARRLQNRYYTKSMRTMLKKVRSSHDAKEAQQLLRQVTAMLDKLAKKGVIHKNNASNKKSRLTRYVNSLS
ncbi:MAG: 30S ribosomal protein S20 [Bacteroidota bacterium]|nr:30S ribosomal protein S20 [Bacteroidota bacterium]